MTDRFTGLSAGNARGALLGAASLVVAAVAVALVLAGVTGGEVAATVLFLPVFAAGFLGGRATGYGGAAVATLVYVALRRADLSDAGVASAGVVTLTRAGAYAVAGHVGALAQMLLPSAAPSGARRPAGTGPVSGRRPLGAEAVRRPPSPADRWDEAPRRRPVLAGVGATGPAGDRYRDDGYDDYDDTGYGDDPTMSGGWSPEPVRDPWQDAEGPRRAGDGWEQPADGGWQDGGGGWPGGPAPGGDRPPGDDSWAAVQQSWRRQHGVPLEDDSMVDDRGPAGPSGWPHDQPHGGGPADAWGAPQGPPGGAGRGPGPGADPWGEQVAEGGGWQDQPGPSGHGGGGWQDRPAADGWPAGGGGHGAPADQWGAAAPTGGTWPQPDGPAGWEPPPAPDQGWGQAPAGGGWPAEGGVNGNAWGTPAPDQGWADAPAAHDGGAWAGHEGVNGNAWGTPAPAEGLWGEAPPSGGEQGWGDAPPSGGEQGWGETGGGDWPADGDGSGGWQDDAGHNGAGGGWPEGVALTGGTFAAAGDARGYEAPAGSRSAVPLPAVDPETGLWTAKFLRDRLTSERARSRRSGRPFSMVLVQVPDGPLAQLPYRRQLTLLRELGYQFVAGGVVDHLVHVPDQAQHWFAVILPDTDSSGSQVLERRLRLGIGGYLSSRGLPLRDLDSASLTSPDDDEAMGTIWEALIGPDGDGSAPPFGY